MALETYRCADAFMNVRLEANALWIATSGWMQRVWTLQEALP